MTTLQHLVYEAVGTASMCWKPRPSGVFDSSEASDVANDLVRSIEKLSKEEMGKEYHEPTSECNP